MKFTGREVMGIFLILAIGLLSLWSWQVFFTAIVTPGVSDIWQSLLWFSVLTMFFFLGTVLWKHLFLRIAGAALISLSGLFFIRSWEYVAAGILAMIFIFWSSVSIARETEERIRFRFFKSARVGQFLFVLGLSLSISGGYYVFLKGVSWEELVPRFRLGEETTKIIFKVASAVNPSFAKLSEGEATVDEFLLSLGQDNSGEVSSPQGDPGKKINDMLFSDARQEEIAQKLFLESGREQVASLAGRPVAGDEKIADVLSLALQNKLITFLSGGKATEHVPSQAVPFFLSLLLFLTLLSFASIFVPLCILGAELLFLLSLRIGWLRLGTISVEQEKLEE